jgi:hypothetical protein
VLSGCSSERRDRLWRTLDPAGYKHSHSASFNPQKFQRGTSPTNLPATNEMELEITQ